MKTCSKCKVPKPLDSFLRHKLGHRRVCKECNPKLCPACKTRVPKRSGGYCQPCTTAYNSAWMKERPEKSKEYNKSAQPGRTAWRRRVYKTDPEFRLRVLLANRLCEVVRKIDAVRAGPVMVLVGCSRAALKAHVESLFVPGMTWGNHGMVWHLDHKKPCAAFDLSDPAQQRACFHWSNLQPLFAQENLRKSDHYESEN